jgi:hypothetical protein
MHNGRNTILPHPRRALLNDTGGDELDYYVIDKPIG